MASNAVQIDLGDMADSVARHLRDGEYESIDDVVREGVRALDREQAAFDAHHRELIDAAFADQRPGLPRREAFAAIRRRIAERRSA